MDITEENCTQIDLDRLASQIPAEREARLRSDELGYVLMVAWYRAKIDPLAASRLRELLGSPDRMKVREGFEIWDYDWIGRHGPNEYTSHTPFVVRNDQVVGILREGRVR